jgi:hypothetical protein
MGAICLAFFREFDLFPFAIGKLWHQKNSVEAKRCELEKFCWNIYRLSVVSDQLWTLILQVDLVSTVHIADKE